LTRTVHGAAGLAVAQRSSEVLFGGSMDGLNAEDLMKIFADVPSCEMGRDVARSATVVDIAAASGLCKSKSDARRLVSEGGCYVNNVRIADIAARIGESMLIGGRVLVLRGGKKNYRLVKVV
jgi:tyrosyl-tRNA synthetase